MSAQPVESPCIDLCTMDEDSGLCMGCKRTLEEIALWGTMSPAQRRAIMAVLDERRH